MFVKQGCPRRQPSRILSKISKPYILTLPHPQGHGITVKCEQPLDELTVKVCSLYHHQNFNYNCTSFVSRTELQTDGRKDRQTIRSLDAPGGPFRTGHKKDHIQNIK